jgi:hypothetical protein
MALPPPPPVGLLQAGAKQLRQKKEPFLPAEDLQLRQSVTVHGANAWEAIAQELPGRTPRQCRERWNLYLAPEIRNDPWTAEEERQLMGAYATIGPRWSLIGQRFPNRTSNNIKNKARQLIRQAKRQERQGARGTE